MDENVYNLLNEQTKWTKMFTIYWTNKQNGRKCLQFIERTNKMDENVYNLLNEQTKWTRMFTIY